MSRERPKIGESGFFGFIFVFLVLVLIFSLAGFFYYFTRPETGSQDKGVDFWLYRHPSQLTGQEQTFFIFIRNKEARDIENVQVTLKFPEGFILISSRPQGEEISGGESFWSFDEIKKRELKEIEIKGRIFGQANENQIFSGNLNFQMKGFSSDFQKSLSSTVALESPILVKLETPDEVSLFEDFNSIVSLKNISAETLSQTEVTVVYPENFFIRKSFSVDRKSVSGTEGEVEINEKKREIKWRVGNLGAGKERELGFGGYLTAGEVQGVVFSLQASLVNGDNSWIQTTDEKDIFVNKFDFDVLLRVKGSETVQTGLWGEFLPVSLIYFNSSRQKVENLSLVLILNQDQYLDFKKINQPLLWSFKEILSGESGEINFDLPFKSSLEAVKNGYSQAKTIIQVTAKGKFANGEKEWEIKSNQVQIKIETDLNLEAESRYYDDERFAIGRGPLPPKIGEETHYWIFWRLRNTTNPTKNVLVKTELPQWVNWNGRSKVNYGSVSYDKNNRLVFWQIPELPVYQGGPYSLVEAGIEVSVIPEISQVGLFLPLTGEIYLTAQDNFAENQILRQVGFLTTELIGDPVAQGLGRVEE